MNNVILAMTACLAVGCTLDEAKYVSGEEGVNVTPGDGKYVVSLDKGVLASEVASREDFRKNVAAQIVADFPDSVRGQMGTSGRSVEIISAAPPQPVDCGSRGGSSVDLGVRGETATRISICNGRDGVDGKSITVQGVQQPADCGSRGGTVIQMGAAGEAPSTIRVCNGEQGSPGTDGPSLGAVVQAVAPEIQAAVQGELAARTVVGMAEWPTAPYFRISTTAAGNNNTIPFPSIVRSSPGLITAGPTDTYITAPTDGLYRIDTSMHLSPVAAAGDTGNEVTLCLVRNAVRAVVNESTSANGVRIRCDRRQYPLEVSPTGGGTPGPMRAASISLSTVVALQAGDTVRANIALLRPGTFDIASEYWTWISVEKISD